MGEYWSQPSKGYSNEPLVTTDEKGIRHVGGGAVYQGHFKADGGLDTESYDKLSKAYDYMRDDTKSAIERWRASKKNPTERTRALDQLFRAYRARGEYKGTREDFDQWFNTYHSDMVNSALVWNGGFTGIPTAGADGTPLRGAPERTGGGTSTAGLYQKAGNPYRTGGFSVKGTTPTYNVNGQKFNGFGYY